MSNKPEIGTPATKNNTSSLADELQKSNERGKKLEAALQEVFPIDVYIKARPDVEDSCDGRFIDILEHYIEYGIHETNIKREGLKRVPSLYDYIKEAATLLSTELQKSKEREKMLETALQEVFPLDLYKEIRQDVAEIYNGDPEKIIEHFAKHGISEIDIKKEGRKNANKTALKIAVECLRNINISQVVKQKNEQEKSRSLLKTKGSLSHLNENQNHKFAIKHTSVHYKSNSVCTWIPKNGCSNLRYSIAKENGAITNIGEIEWIHRNNDCFNASTKEALEASYTFVILRNPFRRLLSFFLDKLCHSQEDQSEMSYQHAQQVFGFHDKLSYSDFIDYIWEYSDSIYKDEHTRPQSDFLLYRDYDSYFSLENLKEANHEIHKKTGIQIDDVRDKNSIFTSKGCELSPEITHLTKASEIKSFLDQNKIPIPENMYTTDMIRKVATLYLQDILVYCSEIPNGCSELENWIQKVVTDE